jgi:hypothetical protein
MTNLIITVVLFGLFACFLAYVSRVRALVKLLVLPAFMVGVTLGYWYFLEEIGKPANIPLPEESEYVAHRITNEDTIIVWLLFEGEDRLYVIPYTRAAAKALEDARQGEEEGTEQSIFSADTPTGESAVTSGEAISLPRGGLNK